MLFMCSYQIFWAINSRHFLRVNNNITQILQQFFNNYALANYIGLRANERESEETVDFTPQSLSRIVMNIWLFSYRCVGVEEEIHLPSCQKSTKNVLHVFKWKLSYIINFAILCIQQIHTFLLLTTFFKEIVVLLIPAD